MNKSINNTNNIEFVNYINDILSESTHFSHLQNVIFKDLIVPPGYYIKNKQPNQEVMNYEFSNDKCSDNVIDPTQKLPETRRKNNNNNKNIDIDTKKNTKKRLTKKYKKHKK